MSIRVQLHLAGLSRQKLTDKMKFLQNHLKRGRAVCNWEVHEQLSYMIELSSQGTAASATMKNLPPRLLASCPNASATIQG